MLTLQVNSKRFFSINPSLALSVNFLFLQVFAFDGHFFYLRSKVDPSTKSANYLQSRSHGSQKTCVFLYWSSGFNYVLAEIFPAARMNHCKSYNFVFIEKIAIAWPYSMHVNAFFCCSIFRKTIFCQLERMSLKEHTYACGNEHGADKELLFVHSLDDVTARTTWIIYCVMDKTRQDFPSSGIRQTGKPVVFYEQNRFI